MSSKEIKDERLYCIILRNNMNNWPSDAVYKMNAFVLERQHDLEKINVISTDTYIPMYIYWDIGYVEPTKIFFIQKQGDEYVLVHHYENIGKNMDHYRDYIRAFKKNHGIERSFGHYMTAKTHSIDPRNRFGFLENDVPGKALEKYFRAEQKITNKRLKLYSIQGFLLGMLFLETLNFFFTYVLK